MIKWVYISLCIGALLFKPISQFSWEIWYLANYEYVAEELCENTDEPELECNGKCFLAQQLEKTELEVDSSSNEQKQPRPVQVKEENLYFAPSCTIAFSEIPEEQQPDHFGYEDRSDRCQITDIFHPPQI
jgi:hypothetical protein